MPFTGWDIHTAHFPVAFRRSNHHTISVGILRVYANCNSTSFGFWLEVLTGQQDMTISLSERPSTLF